MGGSNSTQSSLPYYTAYIRTSDGKRFTILSIELFDHIALLREVIEHPEMTQEGKILDSIIEDYCRWMSRLEMRTGKGQSKLPWQVDWIWHVHRLHPVAYLNDCRKCLHGQVVQKLKFRTNINRNTTYPMTKLFKQSNQHQTFFPSIDLVSAVIRQRDFLQQLKYHRLFLMDLQQFDRNSFEQMVQNYISFIKLAKKGELIVPTFEIDLIWHTHMRNATEYEKDSTTLCGFVVDHNDAIEKDTLRKNLYKTAKRWKKTYQTEYGNNINKDILSSSEYVSNCAMIVPPSPLIKRSTTTNTVVTGSVQNGGDGGGGGDCDGGDGGGGCGGGGCGGGCGGCGG